MGWMNVLYQDLVKRHHMTSHYAQQNCRPWLTSTDNFFQQFLVPQILLTIPFLQLATLQSVFRVQRLMDKVLHGLSFVTSYIDDVLIHSNSMELHQSHLRLVFNRLAKAGLTLRGSKCKIGLDKVQYMGHIFSKDGMAPDTDKIAVVQNWPTPTDVTEVRQFLGLASYYRRNVKNFADIAAPLHHLTQKAVDFNWEENCQQSFQVLKDAIIDSSACLMLSLLQEGIHPTDRCQCSGDRSSAGAGRPRDCLCQPQSNPTRKTLWCHRTGMPGCCLCSQTLQALLTGTTIQPTH